MKLTMICPGRADYSALREVAEVAGQRGGFELRMVLCGDLAFLRSETARAGLRATVVEIDADANLTQADDAGGRIASLVPALLAELRAHPSDCVLVSGDRYELLAVIAAVVPLRVPLAHISGGDCTFGAIDEQIRHAVTKVAHLHFVAGPSFAGRVQRMGEEAWRVHITGDPGLDCILRAKFSAPAELQQDLQIPIDRNVVLVAFHPVTQHPESTWLEWSAITTALEGHAGPVVVTGCNADPQGDELRARQKSWCDGHARRRFAAHLGQSKFLGLLRAGGCLVGNSSAAIWEAPSLGAPAVNVGHRQQGRLRGANVIDVAEVTPEAIGRALVQALDPQFRTGLRNEPNPYGDGHAAPRIVKVLRELPARERLLAKQFHDGPSEADDFLSLHVSNPSQL